MQFALDKTRPLLARENHYSGSRFFSLIWFCSLAAIPLFAAEYGKLALESLPQAAYRFEGLIGKRVQSNIKNWLIPAPSANPGMITMFHFRDRKPSQDLVPWAGEFVGKYLISAIQALRMANSPELRDVVVELVEDLVSSQSDDGYLGPFPRGSRFRENWDLWGHHHCMLALLMWHEAVREESTLQACRRAADLVCEIFLRSESKVIDLGSPESNMAIIHSMGQLYRLTGEMRYVQMMQSIEEEWEDSGDYFRTGLDGVEFFRSPKPMLESLHNLQGLLELYRITGDEPYQRAFTNHWWSIRRSDRRNSGGFSSNERADGNPFAPTSIETCGTVAWMALTIDMLRATGDSRAADELELSTFNAAAGAQHSSGRWWTYDTPMDGTREPSTRGNAFQSRPGTPELNCCSVNGPRSLGMLSDWAVMRTTNGLAINHLGPGAFQGKLANNTPVALRVETDYPLSGRIEVRVEPLIPRLFTLSIRIPEWTRSASVQVNGAEIMNAAPGRYFQINRRWRERDRIRILLDMSLRVLSGEKETTNQVSLYQGPLLLAYDQNYNPFDEAEIPSIDLRKIGESRSVSLRSNRNSKILEPWLLLEVPASGSRSIRLCDFASAGAYGTRYRSWFDASEVGFE